MHYLIILASIALNALMVINARPSEMSEFCPLNEDAVLPEEHMHDADGYPLFLGLGMRDWKGRSEEFSRGTLLN